MSFCSVSQMVGFVTKCAGLPAVYVGRGRPMLRSTTTTAGLLLCLAAQAGCVLGPRALQNSRRPYNEAIQRTSNEQLLLNLVRLKYRETPLFLEVGSVSAQFVFDESGSLSGTINENIPFQPINPNALGLSGRIGYQERPTITYAPLQGEDFVNRLLSPASLETVLLLVRSGWRIDRVLKLTVQGLNGLDNASGASGPTPSSVPEFEKFAKLTDAMLTLQRQGLLELGAVSREIDLSDPISSAAVDGQDLISAAQAGYRFSAIEGQPRYVLKGSKTALVWRVPTGDKEVAKTVSQIRRLLNLAPGQDSYDLRLAAAGKGQADFTESARGERTQIGVATRSLIGTMFYLSQAVEAPKAHRDAGLVTITLDGNKVFDWSKVTGDLFSVRCRATRPSSAAVAVRYRGYWYYIDETDLDSKSTFALLGQLFALQAGDSKAAAPVLTLPVGG